MSDLPRRMTDKRFLSDEPCKNCGTRERYTRDKRCCECTANRARRARRGAETPRDTEPVTRECGARHFVNVAKPKKHAVPPPPVAHTGWFKPLTREQLMARR